VKSSRPHTLTKRLATLSLVLLACLAHAPESKPAQAQAEGSGPDIKKPNPNPCGPFRASEVTWEPFILTTTGQFPASGATPDESRSGLVRLRAVFTCGGEVKDITVIKAASAELAETAVSAAKAILFKPAERDGRPVSQYVTLEYYFHFYYDDGSRDFTRRLSIIEQPRPEYAATPAKRFAGKVSVEAVFGKDGKVEGARVVEGSGPLPGGLSEKVIEAALRIKFESAEVNGRKITVVSQVDYVFPPDAPASKPGAKP
jgi:Gram-negative bacterial TonB protein C-terminal